MDECLSIKLLKFCRTESQGVSLEPKVKLHLYSR